MSTVTHQTNEPTVGLRCSHCQWSTQDHVGQLGNDCPECDDGRMDRWPPEIPTDYAGRKARFAELTDLLAERQADVAETESELRSIEETLLEDMAELGERSYTMLDRTFFMRKELRVGKATGVSTGQVCEALIAEGFGDVVSTSPTYPPATLKSRVNELLKSGEELPAALAAALYVDQPIRLRSRKA